MRNVIVTELFRSRRLPAPPRSYRGGMSPTTSCTSCGRIPSPERPGLLWSLAVENGHRSYSCGPCVRDDLPMIESGVAVTDL
jgi:hypothetical protein